MKMISKNISTKVAVALAVLGITFCSCDEETHKFPFPEDKTPVLTEGDVTVYTTTANRSLDLTVSYINFSQRDNMAPSTIKVDADNQYQQMQGFGCGITGSSCYNMMKMTDAARHKFLVETFSPTEGYGFSYVRVPIGCSDFSLSEYTCCDTEGIENFALTVEETRYIIPVLKEIIAINPQLKIMGSPWTAPRWMKVSNINTLAPYVSWTGGQLNPNYYQDYATYFVKWIEAFKAEGINVTSVTPQNEPLNRGNSASMYMPWEQELDFVKTALGPALERAGLDVKIYAFDHNYNYDNVAGQQKYSMNIFADAEAAKYFAGTAFHNYNGNKDEMLTVHNAYPEKEVMFTEATLGDWNNGSNLQQRLCEDMEEIMIGTANRWCNGSMVWNLMLDENRGPNRPGGCTNGFGTVDIKGYKSITRNSHYYIIAHMSTVVRPGAVRVATEGFSAQGLSYAAFENTDGTHSIVVNNNNSESRQFTIDDGTHHFSYKMPAKSVASFIW